MTQTINLQVSDQVSTLHRITTAFVRLQYNIDELHVTHAQDPGVSNISVTVNIEDPTMLDILLKKLEQQINVLKVSCDS